ncbi:MAG: transcriptional regulator [Neisseria sp.]|uniref:protein YgfX n=1 Tax=Neisseria sp. TaxID=192066 RepID=UPI0026DCF2D4|nr:protein YgfX [Neisseria sp.]MDO4641037.1 transcriptional regulator [Neisseria sp.]
MQAFRAELTPSKNGRLLAVGLHLYALMVCLTSFYGAMRWFGIIALCGSLLWAWRVQNLQCHNSIKTIHIDTSGRATLTRAGHREAAVLLESSLIHRRACFLQWQINGKISWQAVLPDMTDAESYRRLMVWAKFGRSKAALANTPQP